MHSVLFIRAPVARTRWPAALVLRLSLLVGCALVVGIVAIGVEPAAWLGDDPELGTLLRGMALIKAALAMTAIAVVAWRVGHPVDRRTAIGYLMGALLVSGSAAMIWQLAFILPAAVAFHIGALLLLIVAWRDDRVPLRIRLTSPR